MPDAFAPEVKFIIITCDRCRKKIGYANNEVALFTYSIAERKADASKDETKLKQDQFNIIRDVKSLRMKCAKCNHSINRHYDDGDWIDERTYAMMKINHMKAIGKARFEDLNRCLTCNEYNNDTSQKIYIVYDKEEVNVSKFDRHEYIMLDIRTNKLFTKIDIIDEDGKVIDNECKLQIYGFRKYNFNGSLVVKDIYDHLVQEINEKSNEYRMLMSIDPTLAQSILSTKNINCPLSIEVNTTKNVRVIITYIDIYFSDNNTYMYKRFL
jgi:hypothetical protein